MRLRPFARSDCEIPFSRLRLCNVLQRDCERTVTSITGAERDTKEFHFEAQIIERTRKGLWVYSGLHIWFSFYFWGWTCCAPSSSYFNSSFIMAFQQFTSILKSVMIRDCSFQSFYLYLHSIRVRHLSHIIGHYEDSSNPSHSFKSSFKCFNSKEDGKTFYAPS